MRVTDLVGLAVPVALLVYLTVALLRADRRK
jgi:K+-transporting ATPase KdpF subunit